MRVTALGRAHGQSIRDDQVTDCRQHRFALRREVAVTASFCMTDTLTRLCARNFAETWPSWLAALGPAN